MFDTKYKLKTGNVQFLSLRKEIYFLLLDTGALSIYLQILRHHHERKWKPSNKIYWPSLCIALLLLTLWWAKHQNVIKADDTELYKQYKLNSSYSHQHTY